MPAPVIDTRIGEFYAEKGDTISRTVVATNTPTGWSASGLPSGLSINSSGVISGTITADPNLYGYTLTATNADGSDEMSGYFVVADQSSLVGDDQLSLELEIEVTTKKVRVLSLPDGIDFGPPSFSGEMEDGDTQKSLRAVLAAKRSERIPVSIVYVRNGKRQDYDISTISCVAKEIEPELEFELFTGGITKTGTGESARYRTVMYLDPDDWDGIFSNNEENLGTAINALAEIRTEITEAGDAYDQTEQSALSPALSGTPSATQDDLLVFTGIPKTSAASTFDLDLDLVISSDSSQSVSIARTCDVLWNGSNYEVSNFTGSASGSGTDQTAIGKWQSTLTQLSMTGTASGLEITLRTSASTVADRYQIAINLDDSANLSIASGAIVHSSGVGNGEDFYAVTSDDASEESLTITHGDVGSGIKTNFNALPSPFASEVSDVFLDEDAQQIIVVLNNGTDDMAKIRHDLTSYEYSRVQLIAGGSKSGLVKAQLSIASIDNLFTHFTETFPARLERSLHPVN